MLLIISFYDYDGCNALSYGVATCKAGFCAIYLKDCGSDSHDHVLNEHGSYFDKEAFQISRENRTRRIMIISVLLYKNHIKKADFLSEGDNHKDDKR